MAVVQIAKQHLPKMTAVIRVSDDLIAEAKVTDDVVDWHVDVEPCLVDAVLLINTGFPDDLLPDFVRDARNALSEDRVQQ